MYDILESSTNLLVIYHLYYKKNFEITEFAYNSFFLQSFLKLLSRTNILSDFIVKLAIYYLHYKDIQVKNQTKNFVCITNFFHFFCDTSNILVSFFLTYDGSACTMKSGLITKKEKLPSNILYLSHYLKPLSIFV